MANPDKEYVLGTLVYKVTEMRTDMLGYMDSFKLYFKKTQFAAHVYTLGIINEFRSTGLAQEMLKYFEEEICTKFNIKMIYLDVVTYNGIAIKFYLKSGFAKYKQKINYYNIFGKNYDSLELVKYLSEYSHYNTWLLGRPILQV